jgi:hypothetical protein
MVESFGRPPVPNIIAQAKAKQVLKDVHELPDNYPAFRPDLDEQGTFVAYRMLAAGCSLIEQQEYSVGYDQLHAAGDLLECIHRNTVGDPNSAGFHCLVGAMAFYAAGHYSRGFVLIKDVETITPIAGVLASFLRKDNAQLVLRVSGVLLSEALDEKERNETDEYALTVILSRAIAWIQEFSIAGAGSALESARSAIDDALVISSASSNPAFWWLARLLKLILDDYSKRSLWNALPPHFGPGLSEELVQYNRLLALSKPPVTDLWESQLESLSLALNQWNEGGVINLRTSAGKTRVAELAILRTLAEDRSAKVIYLAPFRSLAFELERTFGRFLGSLGYSITHLYGGARFSGIDRTMVTEANLIIATPEKAKALMRAAPELLDAVKLVVVDEGHLLGADERNIKNELFLEHLRLFCRSSGARMILLSAVLPNADQLAAWVGGNTSALAKSDWKPSSERFGILRWRKKGVELEWKGAERCFNPHFVEFRDVQEPGKRKRRFPRNKTEAVAATAVRLIELGPVLIFAGQAQWVASMARAVLLAMGSDASDHDWPDLEWRLFTAVCEEELGPDSLVLNAARLGVVCHSDRLPPQARIALEKLMAAKAPKVIVATMTLGQGVNIGISSVIVNQTLIGEKRWITERDFWNICGRAGRAFVDSEGKVLYAIDATRTSGKVRGDEERARKYLDPSNLGKVQSGLLLVLHKVEKLAAVAEVSFEVLLELVAESRLDELGDKSDDVKYILDLLDDQLLALHQTFKGTDDVSLTADWVEEAFRSSLAAIQEQQIHGSEVVIPLLQARTNGLLKEVQSPAVRKAIVASGLPYSVAVAAQRDTASFRAALDAFISSGGTESALLDLVEHFEVWASENAKSIFNTIPAAESLAHVRPLWLGGKPLRDIVQECGEDAVNTCKGYYGYSLTWLCSAIAQKLDKEFEEERLSAIALVSLLLEVGLPSEAAAKVFLAGVRSRAAALELAIYVEDASESVSRIRSSLLRRISIIRGNVLMSEASLEWLQMLSQDQLEEPEQAPYIPPFKANQSFPDVDVLHVRKLDDTLYLTSTDCMQHLSIQHSDELPFASVANDLRFAFVREENAWNLVIRDPRIQPRFGYDLEF